MNIWADVVHVVNKTGESWCIMKANNTTLIELVLNGILAVEYQPSTMRVVSGLVTVWTPCGFDCTVVLCAILFEVDTTL